MSPLPTLDVVLTNYNAWEALDQSVAAFLDLGGNAIQRIIIIDDASRPPARLPSWPETVTLFTNPENRGYVASVNEGIRRATADLVLVFDADARPLRPFAARLRELFAAEPKLGMVGFQTVDRDGRPTGNSCAFPSSADLFLGQSLASRWSRITGASQGPRCVFSCAMVVRRDAYLAVQGFDERFDFLDADIDFSMRLTQAGYDVRLDDQLSAQHEGGGSPQTTSQRVLRHYRNRYLLLAKHQQLPNKWLLKAVVLGRLALEYLFLNVLGRAFFSLENLDDKILGRKKLLQCVLHEWN